MNYWCDKLVDLVIAFLGAFLGFWLSYSLTIRQERNERKREKEKEKELNLKRIKLLTILLDSVIDYCHKQLCNFKILASEVKGKPYDYHLVGIIANNDLKRIQNLSTEDLFKTYVDISPDEDSIFEYKELFQAIDFLEKRIDQLFSENDKHIEFVHKGQLTVKNSVDSIPLDLLSSVMEYPNENKGKLFKGYLDKFSLQKKELSFEKMIDEILNPLGECIFDNEFHDKYTECVKKNTAIALNYLENIKYNSLLWMKECSDFKTEFEFIDKLKQINEKIKQRAITAAKSHWG